MEFLNSPCLGPSLVCVSQTYTSIMMLMHLCCWFLELHFTIGADDEPRITAMRQQKLEKRKSDKYSMKTLRRREDFQSTSKKEEYYN